MEELLELLKDGRARTTLQLALELHTSIEDICRKLEYLEVVGVIKKISLQVNDGKGCSGCQKGGDPATCKGCIPEGGFRNMGCMWEIIETP